MVVKGRERGVVVGKRLDGDVKIGGGRVAVAASKSSIRALATNTTKELTSSD